MGTRFAPEVVSSIMSMSLSRRSLSHSDSEEWVVRGRAREE